MTQRKRHSRNRQRGIAIVMVMIAIAITLVMSNEFGTSTSIDTMAAANYRDQMRAHFLARSALNLGELVIRIQQRLDNITHLRGQVQITDFADQLIVPFCGSAAEVKDAIGFSTSSVKGLGADIGTCGFDGPMTTEDDKINVNCANTDQEWEATQSALYGLMYLPAYDPVFDEDSADGWHRDRMMQVAAIMDYIDADTMHVRDRGTSEDYGYDQLKDPYFAKNNFIDTVGELHDVRGVDDRFWTLFGKAFTVYGSCKINLAALSNPQLIAGLLYLTAKNKNDPVLEDPARLFLLASYIAKAHELGMIFVTQDDFINFVRNPGAAIGMLAATGGGTLAGSAASSAVAAGLPGLQENIGLELDPKLLSSITNVGPRRTYRLKAYGEIDRAQGAKAFPPIRETLTGVWDTKVVPQNVRKPPAPNGAWVFLKED